jgi:CPA2 family monovalent cation:H+ antiporter-2
VFFMTVGMGLDLSEIAPRWWQIALALVALLIGKAVIAIGACRVFAGRLRLSIEAAALLAPAGEFAFVVLAAAGAVGVLAPESVTFLGAVAGLSMLGIPLLDRLGTRAARRWPADESDAAPGASYAELAGHVVVGGFGRVGQAIMRILTAEDTDFVLLDRDSRRVALCNEQGWKIQLGDAGRPEILQRAGAQGAAMFIVTLDDPASAERMVHAVRRLRPEAPVLARARDAEHAAVLEAAGATFVIPDAIEAGLQMAGRALVELGYTPETARSRISAVREGEYRSATEGKAASPAG